MGSAATNVCGPSVVATIVLEISRMRARNRAARPARGHGFGPLFASSQPSEDGAGGGLEGDALNRAATGRAPLEQEHRQQPPVSDDLSKIWRIGFIGVVLTGPLVLLVLRLLDMQVMGWQQYEPPQPVVTGRNTVDDTTSWG